MDTQMMSSDSGDPPTSFQEKVDGEMRKFQGTWVQIKCVADGVADPLDEFGLEPRTTFIGNTYVVTDKNGAVVIRGTFKLNPSPEPKEVDWTDTCGVDREKTFSAIYSFDGDQLMFCAADEGMKRPKAFKSHIGETLRIHRRDAS